MELNTMTQEMLDRKHECPHCKKEYPRSEMTFTFDCHGISFRLACYDCWEHLLQTKGFDGERYTSADEQIEDDY